MFVVPFFFFYDLLRVENPVKRFAGHDLRFVFIHLFIFTILSNANILDKHFSVISIGSIILMTESLKTSSEYIQS